MRAAIQQIISSTAAMTAPNNELVNRIERNMMSLGSYIEHVSPKKGEGTQCFLEHAVGNHHSRVDSPRIAQSSSATTTVATKLKDDFLTSLATVENSNLTTHSMKEIRSDVSSYLFSSCVDALDDEDDDDVQEHSTAIKIVPATPSQPIHRSSLKVGSFNLSRARQFNSRRLKAKGISLNSMETSATNTPHQAISIATKIYSEPVSVFASKEFMQESPVSDPFSNSTEAALEDELRRLKLQLSARGDSAAEAGEERQNTVAADNSSARHTSPFKLQSLMEAPNSAASSRSASSSSNHSPLDEVASHGLETTQRMPSMNIEKSKSHIDIAISISL